MSDRTDIDLEELSSRLHDIYQKEIIRQGKNKNHSDSYSDLAEDIKELDRVLARWILANWVPGFDPKKGLPTA